MKEKLNTEHSTDMQPLRAASSAKQEHSSVKMIPAAGSAEAQIPTDTSPEGLAAREAFLLLYTIIKRLREPDGCPWDREQTPMTLRSTLLEETYEVLEALEEVSADSTQVLHAAEELGDVLLNIVMIAYMFEQMHTFSTAQMITLLNEKLVRRHPHVFGQTAGFPNQSDAQKPLTAGKVLAQWEKIKERVEGRASNSILDAIPKTFPPLARAYKLQKRASKKGFDWESTAGPQQKIEEECAELNKALTQGNQDDIESEFGDILFSLVNEARHLHIDPAVALSRSNAKFERRFRFVEKRMAENGMQCSRETLAEMEKFWEEAKRAESTKTNQRA